MQIQRFQMTNKGTAAAVHSGVGYFQINWMWWSKPNGLNKVLVAQRPVESLKREAQISR
jgi:hypothetical protein